MSVIEAFVDGWRRVSRAPVLVAGLLLLNAAIALPAALALAAERIAVIEASQFAGRATPLGIAADYELLSQATGLGQTLVPAWLGMAVVAALSDYLAAPDRLALVAASVAAVILLAPLLLGGTLDRLARARRLGPHGYFAACGAHLFPLLRLMAIAAAIYGVLTAWVYPALAQLLGAAAGVCLLALLIALDLVVDYAEVRLVVEDRHSAIGALAAAARFIRRHLAAVAGLHAAHLALVPLALAAAAMAGDRGTVLLAYLAVRVVMRLAGAGSRIALFQSRLAHAGYTARPMPEWPESAAAEAIRPDR